jgi:FMN-dependent NADH-azoreductase
MSKILVVHSSPRQERSVSRKLTNDFVQQWLKQHPEAKVVTRDVARQPVPHVSEDWIIGAFSPADTLTPDAKAAIDISNELVDELFSADRYVFAVPMYNFNVPSTFKAYLDQIVRVGRTFSVGANGYQGLLKDKKALFVTSSGGSFPAGSPYAAYNFQEPYLRAVAAFLGITDVQFVVADGLARGDDAAKNSIAKAESALNELVTSW